MNNWFFKKNFLIDQLVTPNLNKISIVDKLPATPAGLRNVRIFLSSGEWSETPERERTFLGKFPEG